MGRAVWLLALVAGCHYDLDAVDRPRDGGSDIADGGDGAADASLPDPCPVDAVPAAVHLHGAVLDAASSAPIEDVTIDANPGGNDLSSGDGSFAIDVALDGTATPISLVFDPPDGGLYPLHRHEFQRPFDRPDVDIQERLHSYDQLDASTLYGYDDNPAREPGTVTVVAWVFDCSDGGRSGAVLTVEPAPDAIIYFGGGSSTDPTGVAYALNAAAGEVTATATGSEPFTFEAEADSVTVVQLVVP